MRWQRSGIEIRSWIAKVCERDWGVRIVNPHRTFSKPALEFGSVATIFPAICTAGTGFQLICVFAVPNIEA